MKFFDFSIAPEFKYKRLVTEVQNITESPKGSKAPGEDVISIRTLNELEEVDAKYKANIANDVFSLKKFLGTWKNVILILILK